MGGQHAPSDLWKNDQGQTIAQMNQEEMTQFHSRRRYLGMHEGDCSMIIIHPKKSDEGTYTCRSTKVSLVILPELPRAPKPPISTVQPLPLSNAEISTVSPIPTPDPLSTPVTTKIVTTKIAPTDTQAPAVSLPQSIPQDSPVPDHSEIADTLIPQGPLRDLLSGLDHPPGGNRNRAVRKAPPKPGRGQGGSRRKSLKTALSRQVPDPLYRIASNNGWFKWSAYTTEAMGADDCYFCSRPVGNVIRITNTQYSWKNCEEEKIQKVNLTDSPNEQFNPDHAPFCKAECLQYLGSREYYNESVMEHQQVSTSSYLHLGTPVMSMGERCSRMDVRVSEELKTIPLGTKLELVGLFECFEKERFDAIYTTNLGKLDADHCETIWDLSYTHFYTRTNYEGECRPRPGKLPKTVAKQIIKGRQTSPPPRLCPLYYATQAVADQFWLCGENQMYPVLPVNWTGRCARVQPVQTIVVIPASDLQDKPTGAPSRARREVYEMQDNPTYIDDLGVPQNVPKEFKAIDVTALGFVSFFMPTIGIDTTSRWINYIFYNQQRFFNFTHNALGAIGQQLAATSEMAWQNRQVLDFLMAERGGVCSMFGDYCCTYIPNSTAPNGTFTKAMSYLEKLRDEVNESAGKAASAEWTAWLEDRLGVWGAWVASIGSAILLGLLLIVVVLCCCFPLIRNLVVKYMSQSMNFQATQLAMMTAPDPPNDAPDEEEERMDRVFSDVELCLYQSDASQTDSGQGDLA